MKKLILIFVLILLPLVSFAAIDIQKRNDGITLTTAKNTYTAGNLVNVFQEKSGDVYAAGNIVSVTGSVGQDLVAVAGNINITSEIGGDVRVAAGNINIGGPIDGELLAAGGQIAITPSSVIRGDFIGTGGRVNIDGTINGNARITADEIYISGVLNKDADIKAGRLVIEKTAVINGNVNYQGKEEMVVNEGAKINGKISFSKIETGLKKSTPRGFVAALGIFWFIKFLMLIVAALVLFFLMRRSIPKISSEAVDNFWKKMLHGFIILVVIPAAVIFSFITVIGSLVGLFGIALYGLLIIIATVFAGIIAAELLNRLIFRGQKARPLNWPMVILGVIAMEILAFIPFIGWIANFLIFLVAFGTISNLLYRQTKVIAE